MQHDIIEKIRKLVDKGVESEAECVCFLAQIRKYLEEVYKFLSLGLDTYIK